MLAVVALVIGVLLTSGVLASVAGGVECNVTKVLGRGAGCSHQPNQSSAKNPAGAAAGGRRPDGSGPAAVHALAAPQDPVCPPGSSPAPGPYLPGHRPCVTASGEQVPPAQATAPEPCPAGTIPDIGSVANGPPWPCVPGTPPPPRNPWLPATIQPDPWPRGSCPVGFDYHTYQGAAYCERRWVDGHPSQLEEAPELPAAWQPAAGYSLNDLLNGKNPDLPNGQEVAVPEGYGAHAVVGPVDPTDPNGGLQYFPNGPEEENIYDKVLEGLQEQWKEKAPDIFDDLEKREEVERQIEDAAARKAEAETNGVQYPNDPGGGEDPRGGEDGEPVDPEEPVDPLPPLVEGGEVGGE